MKSGDSVKLSGEGSSDPDNDQLKYHWIHYKEVGTLPSHQFKMENTDQMFTLFTAPKIEKVKTMHFILEVTDDGVPSLARYQRVIVNVFP